MGHAVLPPLFNQDRPRTNERNDIRVVEEKELARKESVGFCSLDESSVVRGRLHHFWNEIVEVTGNGAGCYAAVQGGHVHDRASTPGDAVSANSVGNNIFAGLQVIDHPLNFELFEPLQAFANEQRLPIEPASLCLGIHVERREDYIAAFDSL